MPVARAEPSPTMLYPPPSYPLSPRPTTAKPTKTATAEAKLSASTTPPPDGLATTGPSGWLIVGAGLALVLVGVILLLVIRRHRLR